MISPSGLPLVVPHLFVDLNQGCCFGFKKVQILSKYIRTILFHFIYIYLFLFMFIYSPLNSRYVVAFDWLYMINIMLAFFFFLNVCTK
jgi:hypothetical protein